MKIIVDAATLILMVQFLHTYWAFVILQFVISEGISDRHSTAQDVSRA